MDLLMAQLAAVLPVVLGVKTEVKGVCMRLMR